MSPKFVDILRLGRIHTAMATAAIPTSACIAAGGDPISVALVVLGSLMHHAWGFSLNEIIDLEVDRGNPDLEEKPLVSGRVSVAEGHIISNSFLLISLLSFAVAGFISSDPFYLPLILIISATVLGGIYDLRGKRFPLSDVFMGSWMFFLVLAGAFSSGNIEGMPFTPLSVAIMGGIQILFNNSVEGGLKDVRNDRASGTKTLAVTLGATYNGNVMRPGKGIINWGVSLRMVYVLFGSAASLLISQDNEWGVWIVIASAVTGIIVFVHSLTYLRQKIVIRRKELLKVFAKHEVLSFLFLMVVIMPAIGWMGAVVLFTVPFLYYIVMNRIMFDSSLAPGV